MVTIHQENQGPAIATNRAIAASRGKFVALFSGDDLCHPDRLRIQLDACSQGPRRLLFSGVDFIDDDGLPLEGDNFAAAWFDGGPLSRAQALARLFQRGNFLNGVTTFAERDVFAAAPYDPTLLQLQDFDLWMRLAKDCDIQVLPDQLVSYRIRPGGGNLSAPGADAIIRCTNEHYLILRRCLAGVPMDLFKEAFADSIIRPEFAAGIEYDCERAFLYTRSNLPMARAVGIERLHALLNEPASADVLARCYHFTPVQFFDLMRTQDVFNVLGGHFSTIYLDTGGGFVAGQEVRVPIRPVAGPFQLHFDLPAAPGLQTLRWDPIEGRTCRVRIDAVDCVAADGGVHSVESSTIATNGIQISPGSFDFETNDPNIWWPTSEGVKQVIVKGHWEFDQLPETVQELRRQIVELKVACETVPRKSARATLKFARRVLSRLKVG